MEQLGLQQASRRMLELVDKYVNHEEIEMCAFAEAAEDLREALGSNALPPDSTTTNANAEGYFILS